MMRLGTSSVQNEAGYIVGLTLAMAGVQCAGMSDELPHDGFSIEGLGESAQEQARHQLALLEVNLTAMRDPSGASALMDEVFRAAHALRWAAEPHDARTLLRLARRMQDVVKATRSGRLRVHPDLCSVLASIARIARDALDDVIDGKAETAGASSAAATLEEMLTRPETWTAPASLAAGPAQFARVDARRLGAAESAAGQAGAAAEQITKAAEEAAATAQRIRSLLAEQDTAVKALREALPRGLARAAGGEAVTIVAAELSEAVGGLVERSTEVDQLLSRSAARVREAALAGAHAVEAAGAALSTLGGVRLDSLLHSLPGLVRRAARQSGREIDCAIETAGIEVDGQLAEAASGAINACARALLAPLTPRRRGRRPVVKGRMTLLVEAGRQAGSVSIHVTSRGAAGAPVRMAGSLAAAQKRLRKHGGSLELESRAGQRAALHLTIPSSRAAERGSAEFIVARAGDSWYAIPSLSVIECIEAGLSHSDYTFEGAPLPSLRMNGTREPREAVVVRTGQAGAVLLFDEISGSEAATPVPPSADQERMEGVSGTVRRADATVASVIDLEALGSVAGGKRKSGKGR